MTFSQFWVAHPQAASAYGDALAVDGRDAHRVARYSTSMEGVHECVYVAPPTVASETAYPDVFGRSDSKTFTITP